MKKVVLLCFLFAAALASANSTNNISQTYGYTPITAQGSNWGFNNGPNPAIALNLYTIAPATTPTLQLGSVVFKQEISRPIRTTTTGTVPFTKPTPTPTPIGVAF